MIVKPGHMSVEMDGTVNLQYLQTWSPQRSNLMDLVKTMSSVFSHEPPLFTRPPGYSLNNPIQTPGQQQGQQGGTTTATATVLNTTAVVGGGGYNYPLNYPAVNPIMSSTGSNSNGYPVSCKFQIYM